MKRDLQEHKYSIRDILQDDVTGFKGAVLAIAEQLSGCTHYGLCPVGLDKEEQQKTWGWFDGSRLQPVMKVKKGKESASPDRSDGFVPDMWDQKFNLRDALKDSISGFGGVVISVNFYSTGCVTYELVANRLDRDGKIGDTVNLDQDRVELVKAYNVKKEKKPHPFRPPSPPCDLGSGCSREVQ